MVAGLFFVYLSLAETASMAPTSGVQYHWTSQLALESMQKVLSYIVGWLCFAGWQGATCAICYLSGPVIQGLIILNDESYVPQSWHWTLLVIAVAAFSVLFNTVLAKRLPLVEAILLAMHVLGFVAIVAVLRTLAPVAKAGDVCFEFTDAGGWNSFGTATKERASQSRHLHDWLRLCSPHVYEHCPFSTSNGFTNMWLQPKRCLMLARHCRKRRCDTLLGFIMAIALTITLGNVDEILTSATGTQIHPQYDQACADPNTGYAFIQIFYNTTRSYVGASIRTLVIILTLVSSAIAEVATASRELWSFARDRGISSHRWIAHISPGLNVPLDAVLMSLLATSLLSLINIGSSVALHAILSLTAVSLLTSYIIVIACLVIKRIRGLPLPVRRWSLGTWGLPINVAALCFLAPIFVFSFFPIALLVTASMNWAIVIYAVIIGVRDGL